MIKYVAYTWQGDRVEGVLQVNREEEARDLLLRDDLIPYRLVQVRPRPSLSRLAPYLFKPKPQEIIDFTRSMAALLRAGIPLHEAVVMFRAESRGLGLKEILRRVIEDIEGGMRFSEAMARHPAIFSTFYLRILKFGEVTGGMARSLHQLADNLEKNKVMRDKVKSALVYPVISLVMAIGVAIILITFSLPALVGMLEEFGGELPFVTKLLISIADFITLYRTHMLATIAVTGGAVAAFFKTRRGARMRDAALLRVPVVSGVLVQSNLFTFTSVFATLLEAGIPSVEALRLSSDSLTNLVLRHRLELIIDDVIEGGRLGVAFKEHWPKPPMLSQAIITGEAAGGLAVSLHGLADYYEQESAKTINSALELIQPLVIILVAGLVGFVATAVMSGIYSALDSIE